MNGIRQSVEAFRFAAGTCGFSKPIRASSFDAGESCVKCAVNIPCWALFLEQPATYCDSVLGPGTVKATSEANGPIRLKHHVGATGKFVGMGGFWAGARCADLYRHFGITAVAANNTARAALKGH